MDEIAELKNKFFFFDTVEFRVNDFESEGYILDIGGGGEGVIGRLKGRDAISIDLYKDELEEAGGFALKIVMDARDLKFLDNSFSTTCAFFSMMYIDKREDQLKVMREAFRILKPGACFHLWDADISKHLETDKDSYVVQLLCHLGNSAIDLQYGNKWPDEKRGEEYYQKLAEESGFTLLTTETFEHIFYKVFVKQ